MIRRSIKYSIRKRTSILWICVLGMTIASFMEFSSTDSMDREVSNLESRIHKRQKLLEEFAVKTFKHPTDQFLSFEEELPEDMVIYRYFDNTLHSWANQLPISNDDIDLFTFGYTLNHLNSTVVTNTPLAYLGVSEQYVSLGSAWYIVNIYSRNNQTVITALLVQ